MHQMSSDHGWETDLKELLEVCHRLNRVLKMCSRTIQVFKTLWEVQCSDRGCCITID